MAPEFRFVGTLRLSLMSALPLLATWIVISCLLVPVLGPFSPPLPPANTFVRVLWPRTFPVRGALLFRSWGERAGWFGICFLDIFSVNLSLVADQAAAQVPLILISRRCAPERPSSQSVGSMKAVPELIFRVVVLLLAMVPVGEAHQLPPGERLNYLHVFLVKRETCQYIAGIKGTIKQHVSCNPVARMPSTAV